MAEHPPPVFAVPREPGAPVRHYTVCSTLDSAPQVGSIAMEPEHWAPEIGR